MADPKQRGFYRITYPRPARPTFTTTDGREWEVVDCSESGLRYAQPPGVPLPTMGAHLTGVVRFKTGQEHRVAGLVVRFHEDTVAIRFTGDPIPFSTILGEQKYLRRTFVAQPDKTVPPE